MDPESDRRVDEVDVSKPGAPAARTDKSPKVTCVARSWLGEEIDGVMHRIAPGEEFVIRRARAEALGPLVEIQTKSK